MDQITDKPSVSSSALSAIDDAAVAAAALAEIARAPLPSTGDELCSSHTVRAILERGGEYSSADAPLIGKLIAEHTALLSVLRQSEDRFRGAFGDAAIGMALVGVDGRWLRVNPSLCRIVGYTEAELLATDFQSITHRDDLNADLELVQKLIAGEIPHYHMPKRYHHKRGHEVWVMLSVSLVRDSGGRPLYFVSQIQDISEQRASREALRTSERQFRLLTSMAPVGIFQCDLRGINVFANEAWCAMTGILPQQVEGTSWLCAIHPDDSEETQRQWVEAVEAGGEYCGELRYVAKSGKTVWAQCKAVPMHDAAGKCIAYLGTAVDITERRHHESLEQDRRLVLELVAQDRPLAEVLTQVTGLIERQACDAIAAVIPVVGGELLLYGPSLPQDFSRTLQGHLLPLATALVSGALEKPAGIGVTDIAGEPVWQFALGDARKAGIKTCWTTQIRSSDGTPLGLIVVFSRTARAPSDAELSLLSMVNRLVTVSIEHYQTTRQLAHLVRHDSLTGLPNRILFEDRLQQALASAKRNDKLLSMFELDMDHFKEVNDTLGHQAGDELLQQLASRLRDQLRKTDTLARVGGDEFLLLLPEVAMECDVDVVAEKLLAALEKPFTVADKSMKVSLSIGIAVFPRDGEDGVSLLRQADAAMYRAKQAGRGGYSR